MPTCAVSYKTFSCHCADGARTRANTTCPAPRSQEKLVASGLGTLRSGGVMQLADYSDRHHRKLFVWRQDRDPVAFARARALLVAAGLMVPSEIQRHKDLSTFAVCGCHIDTAAVYKDDRGTWQVNLNHERPFLSLEEVRNIIDPDARAARRASAYVRASNRQQESKTISPELFAKVTGERDVYEQMYEDKSKCLNGAIDSIAALLEVHDRLVCGKRALLEELSAAVAEREAREAQLLRLADYLTEQQDEITTLSAALATASENHVALLSKADKDRLIKVTQSKFQTGEFVFTLDTIKSICNEAGTPGEYLHLLNSLPPSARLQQSPQALRLGHKAAFQFVLQLQLAGQNVDLISTALDLLTAKKKAEVVQSVVGHSAREAQRNKKQAVENYDKIISKHIHATCRTPGAKEWVKMFFLSDDDFTRYCACFMQACVYVCARFMACLPM